MANPNAPFGLRPVRHRNGMTWNGATNDYPIADNYGTALGLGDPVKWSSGKLVIAAAGDPIVGIFQGCSYTITATGKKETGQPYYDGVTGKSNIMAHVADDPGLIFEVQMVSYAATDIGTKKDFVAGTPSGSNFQSTFYLNSSGDGLTILGKVPDPSNEDGAYARVWVTVAYDNHLLA